MLELAKGALFQLDFKSRVTEIHFVRTAGLSKFILAIKLKQLYLAAWVRVFVGDNFHRQTDADTKELGEETTVHHNQR